MACGIPVWERGPVVQKFAAVGKYGVARRSTSRAIGDISLARQGGCSGAKNQVKSEGGGGDELHNVGMEDLDGSWFIGGLECGGV